jgi:uncharacterized YkwD family protein
MIIFSIILLEGSDSMRKIMTKGRVVLIITFIFIISSLLFRVDIFASRTNIFKWTNIKQIEITTNNLNVRTGPSTSYKKIGTVSSGDVLDVLGMIGSWYVIHMENGSIGVISSTYTKASSYYNPAYTSEKEDKYSNNLSAEETLMINLINSERKKAGLPDYKIDMELMKVARIKSRDISNNKYFSHNSPIYGSPFKMLKDFSIDYNMAGENIAGNSTIESAMNSLMNSPSHNINILSTDYNYIGIGITNDPRYGKVFTQLFVQK